MALTYSIPRITFSTPIYDNPLVADVTTICRMYIRAPSRQQIKLTLRDIETNPSKQVIIYDHPTDTSSQYQVFQFHGILNDSAVIISTQGGLNIYMNDVNSLYNGKGFSAVALIYNYGIRNEVDIKDNNNQNNVNNHEITVMIIIMK